MSTRQSEIYTYQRQNIELKKRANKIAKRMAEPNLTEKEFKELNNSRTNILSQVNSNMSKISHLQQGRGYLGIELAHKL